MKVSHKAALLSTFVFPGVGQLYLKKFWRGLGLMVIVFAGLGYMIWSATVAALNLVDDAMVKVKSSAPSLQKLSDSIGSKMINTDPYVDIVFYVMVCFWIFAVIDAYKIGKQKDKND